MAIDQVATLRSLLRELRALRVRINRQIAEVQKALKPTGRTRTGTPTTKTRASTARRPRATTKKTATKRSKTARKRTVGFVRDRQALASRLGRKTRK